MQETTDEESSKRPTGTSRRATGEIYSEREADYRRVPERLFLEVPVKPIDSRQAKRDVAKRTLSTRIVQMT